MKVNRTEYIVLQLLRAAVFGSSVQYTEETDWNAVFDEMSIHRVASIPCDLLGSLPLDEETRRKWQSYCVNQQIFYQKIATAQTELCTAFKETGIDFAIIKGMSAAVYYPVSAYRTMGDIDMLIREADVPKAEKLLWGLSYNRIRGINDRHRNYRKNGIELELHTRFARMKDESREKMLNAYLMNSMENAAGMLPVSQNGMVILQHLRQHLPEGIGLRQVMDWMMFVHASGLTDWTEFNEISQQAGVFTFQKTLTKLCVKYLGLPAREDIAWCDDADEELYDELMQFVFSKGNFGYKTGVTDNSGKIATSGNIFGAFARLQRGGLCRWEAARRHPILRPFAWIYQLIRVRTQLNPAALKSDLEEARHLTAFLNKIL